MQVKTYTGPTTTAVMAAIKAELGPEAVILETRDTRKNGPERVSITAALDRGAGSRPGASSSEQAFMAEGGGTARNGNGHAGDVSLPAQWREWREEWASIKHHLLTLMKPELRFESLTPRQRLAVEYLEREGVGDETLLRLCKRLAEAPGMSVLDGLARLMPVRPWDPENWQHKVHMLAGPYGVGKTTSAIRLALYFRKRRPGMRIALVNADADRGGGRLLLRNYCELSDVAYREIRDKMDWAKVLAEINNFDALLVDLPSLGRDWSLDALTRHLGLDRGDEAMHLVLSPGYSDGQFRTFRERYAPPSTVRDASVIWTKLDEAEHFGQIVNVSAAMQLPLSGFSFGPGLRQTLAPVRENALWRLLFKAEMPRCAD